MIGDPEKWAEGWEMMRANGFAADEETFEFLKASLGLANLGHSLATEVYKVMSKLIAGESLTNDEVVAIYNAQHAYFIAHARAFSRQIIRTASAEFNHE